MSPRVVAVAAVAAAVLGTVLVVTAGGGSEHRLHAVFSSATNIVPGLDVQAAGRPVGKITGASANGSQARLELTITDERAWPLTKGTRATLRWGGTSAFASRYVNLEPGPEDAAELENGSVIGLSDTVAPVELDRLLRTLDEHAQDDLRATIVRGGAAFGRSDRELQDVLRRTPDALDSTRGLLTELGDDPAALDTLVRTTDSVVHAVNSANPGLEALVADAAATFDAVAGEAAGLRATLAEAPSTVAAARGTLRRADTTLLKARELTRRLGPGIRELRTITGPANSVLRRLDAIGPLARGTLATLRSASPDLVALLESARPLMPKLTSIGEQAEQQAHCITPYGPEIAGFATTWGGFLKNGDSVDKYARIHGAGLPFPEDSPMTSEQVVDRFPGQEYAFPRPPGQNVAKPWFIEECGVGPEALDASQDPEARQAVP